MWVVLHCVLLACESLLFPGAPLLMFEFLEEVVEQLNLVYGKLVGRVV